MQRAWLNEQVAHSETVGAQQESQPSFLKVSFVHLIFVVTTSVLKKKNRNTPQNDLWMFALTGCL